MLLADCGEIHDPSGKVVAASGRRLTDIMSDLGSKGQCLMLTVSNSLKPQNGWHGIQQAKECDCRDFRPSNTYERVVKGNT